jgi:myo-inositol 2-dehydrogenase / D-chiro-inositol 1-dehydrogenase
MRADGMSARPTRLAVIGAGRIGSQHALAVQASALLELAAVVDPNAAARDAVAGDGVLRLASIDALLRNTQVEGAIVAVPSARHVEVVSHLLHAGIPVLCEKPCGLQRDDVLALAALSCETGTHLQVGYWRRFVPALHALRERIASGALGEISMLVAVQWDGEPPPTAFRDPASSGGILVDMGVHEFDMLRWLTGQEIVAITGFASEVAWAEPVVGDPETVNLVARLSGGATASISLVRRYPPGDLCRVEVLGGDGSESVLFLDPAAAEPPMLPALQSQAEALAARDPGDMAASVEDSLAALDAAEMAAAALGALQPSAVLPTTEVVR